MHHCQSPYELPALAGDVRFDVGLARYVRQRVACGNCPSCQANRKQNWTGRLIGEARESGSAAFVTLTYKHEPNEFRYRDVALMLKRFRKALWKHERETVRFFCVGEYGDRFGRRHWHLIFFFRQGHRMRRMKQGELWEHWPHGWAAIEDLRGERIEQKVRYCVMYALKDYSGSGRESPRVRSSLKPALGASYFERLAKQCALERTCPTGDYCLPGIVWKQGHKAGQMQTFRMKGAAARTFAAAYAAEWQRLWGDEPMPRSDFLRKNDDEWADIRIGLPSDWLANNGGDIGRAVDALHQFVGAHGVGGDEVVATHVVMRAPDGVGCWIINATRDGRLVCNKAGLLFLPLSQADQDRLSDDFREWRDNLGDEWKGARNGTNFHRAATQREKDAAAATRPRTSGSGSGSQVRAQSAAGLAQHSFRNSLRREAARLGVNENTRASA